MVSMHDGTRVTARIGRWAAVEQLFLSFTTCTCMCMCMSCCMYRIFVIMAPRVRGLGVWACCAVRGACRRRGRRVILATCAAWMLLACP